MLIGPDTLRTGIGYDVHRFAESPDKAAADGSAGTIRLGGVDVPYHRQLLAHSDGDALLGAAGLGDIGERFPDTDPAYKGADSLGLLREVARMLKEKGYAVCNIDATLIGQEPKIAPYKKDMATAIAAAAGIRPEQVNVKGTTTEKLGFTGRKEGLAAEAVCLLFKETD